MIRSQRERAWCHALFASILFCATLSACGAPNEEAAEAEGEGVPKAELSTVRPAPPEITADDVYEFERHWPNIVALSRSWSPPGTEQVLKARHRGALVRVERDGRARVDFGRHGVHEIPIEATDLPERATRIRSGTLHKAAPNFVLSVGTRLVDPMQATVQPLPSIALASHDVFVCVFADPTSEFFEGLVRTLTDLAQLDGVGLILFPQGVSDVELSVMHERLRSMSWSAPYAYPRLTPDHTRSILGARPEAATALLLTPNGRVLLETDLEDPAAATVLRDALRGASVADRSDEASMG